MCERELENRVRRQSYVTVSFRLPRDMYMAILDMSRKRLVSVSDVIREALIKYLGEAK